MNVLYLYESTQTYTNAIYEHISSFARFSRYKSFFCHQDRLIDFNVDLSEFDAVGIHFSIRLPFDEIAPSTRRALQSFSGLKFVFIQDEYDNTHRAWYWIRILGIGLVFTVVPEKGIRRIYPSAEFPNTRFVSNLTGYVPDNLVAPEAVKPPSQRSIVVGYRGRPLPIRYGKLGFEKVEIGKQFKTYCDSRGIRNDIAWTEDARIYGPAWYEFMASCRAMLGSESGSNVFDWDGTLGRKISWARLFGFTKNDTDIYERFVRAKEIDGVMNQVSPRIFEAIANRTVLVLYEGTYSGVVEPGIHFVSVRKDGSNIEYVMRCLEDASFVDEMAERAYTDVIASGRYSYKKFVEMVDDEIFRQLVEFGFKLNSMGSKSSSTSDSTRPSTPISVFPLRAQPPLPKNQPAGIKVKTEDWARRRAYGVWGRLPVQCRSFLKTPLRKLLKRG